MAGLLSRILRSPELMAALGVGGGAALTSDEDDNEIIRALAGAAVGGAGVGGARRAVRGLLGRVPTQAVSSQDKTAAAIAARKALGQTGSAATQFPSGQAVSKLDEYAELLAMQKYGDRIGQNGIDRAIDGLDEIGRLGSKVWDGVDAIAHRAAPIDRFHDLKGAAKEATPWLIGGAMAGGVPAAAMMFGKMGADGEDAATKAKVLQTLGVDPTPTGLMLFQAQNGLPPTGEWDEQTLVAVAKALQGKQAEDAGPPAPSLAPHNRR